MSSSARSVRPRPRAMIVAALLLVAFFTPAHAAAQSDADTLRLAFASDFAHLVNVLRAEHPKLQRIRERAAFDSVVRESQRRLLTLSHTGATLEILRLLSSLDDGHTGLQLGSDARFGFHRYAIEVAVLADGIWVTRTDATAAKLLGRKLTRVGPLSMDELRDRIQPYLTGDNEMGRQNIFPARFVLHELLATIGAADARGALFVGADPLGKIDSLRLPVPATATTSLTLSARDSTRPLPVYMRNRARPFWSEPVPGAPLMYAQINALARDPGMSFAAWVDSLFQAIESNGSDVLILDLRNNGGGDGTLAKTLVQRIIRTPQINRRGHLYVVIGRTTFSAAVILAAALENETEATFIGEPTGAPANHYGEPARLELPRTGLRVSYSRLYWQNGDPRDARPWIPPSIPAPLTFADWRTGEDLALDIIMGLNGRVKPSREHLMPRISVGGAYTTRAELLSDGCGGMQVRPSLTIVEHSAGATSFSIVNAGIRYAGSVGSDGAFTTPRTERTAANASFGTAITGGFSAGGFRALVTIEVRDPARAASCSYTVAWLATKEGTPNVIPGR